jgi:SAM-dependent methyltransferase
MTDTVTVSCSACGESLESFLPGPAGRPDARCPACESLERHRFLAILLQAAVRDSARRGRLLDVAPMRRMSDLLRALNPQGYVSIDFDPEADGRLVDLVASLTDLPFEDDSVGLLVCYHVLEHIPDDRTAMSEIARTLRSDGLALVQVPWRPQADTDEDPDAPEEERLRRFGQADHVRYYGRDFVPRLEAAGLHVTEIRPMDLLGDELIEVLGLVRDETVWMCATDPAALPSVDEVRREARTWVASTMARGVAGAGSLARLRTVTEQRDKARARARRRKRDADRWRRRYLELSGRRSVRLLSAVTRPFH